MVFSVNIYLGASIAFMFCLIIPTILVFALKKHEKALKITTLVFLTLYLTLLFIGTTAELGYNGTTATFIVVFNKSWFTPSFMWFGTGILNLLVNIFLLFPVGFITFVFAKKHKFLKTILFAFALSIFIETYQMVLPIHRNTELGDVILNTISGAISAIYCFILSKLGAFNKQ